MFEKPIPLLDFQPDADPRIPGVLLDMNNIKGTGRGLVPSRKFAVINGANLPSRSLGAYTATLSDGRQLTIAGCNPLPQLFDQNTQSWNNFGFFVQTASPSRFRFATFGIDIIATNATEGPIISADGVGFVRLSTFSDLPTDYIASSVAVVDEGIFLVQAGTDSWRFSTDPLSWTPSVQQGIVLSGVPGVGGPSGPITGAVRCRGGIAFYKSNSLSLGRFSGPPFFWNFTTISENVGCVWQEAIINAGDLHLFVGPDDFWIFDGSSLARIPNEVKDWFFARITPTQPLFPTGTPFPTIIGRWDAKRGTAIWHYATQDATAGTLNEWIAFNLRDNKWTRGTQLVSDILLDSLPRIDSANDVVQYVPAVFDTDDTLMQETDDPDESYILTGEYGDGNSYFQLSRVRPIFARWPTDNKARLQAFKRRIFGYPVPDPNPFPQPGVGPSAWLTKDGAFNFIQTARSHQLMISFLEDCDYEITALQGDLVFAGEE